MTYSFYYLAQQQPDLKDVVEYIKNPILILEELHKKILQCTQQGKNLIENSNIQCLTDKIINKHFPDLIEKYCELSINYRNTCFIKEKIENNHLVKYTAKELLLINIGKLIEEIQLLEQRFNDTNSYDFLVTTRLVSDLGNQPQIIELEPHSNVEKITLNQFDYSNFKKSPQFLSTQRIEGSISPEKENISSIQSNIEPFLFSTVFLHIFSLFILISVSFYVYSSFVKNYEKRVNTQIVYNIGELSYMIRNLYINSSSYDSLNPQLLAQAAIISPKLVKNDNISISDSVDMDIKPYTIQSKNDSFKMSMTGLSYQSCSTILPKLYEPNTAIINEHVVNDFPTHVNEAITYCSNENNNISLIYK